MPLRVVRNSHKSNQNSETPVEPTHADGLNQEMHNPVGEGTTRRGTATPVHHLEKPAGSTHSSTRGMRLPEQLERQPEFHSSDKCLSLCNTINCSTPGLPVHHIRPEFTQTHIHRGPNAPGKAPNHIHTTLRWGRAPGMKAQHEGALTPTCIIWKNPQGLHTARQGA